MKMSVNLSSSSSVLVLLKDCNLPETNAIMLSLLIASVFTTPLFVFILVLGFQKWRKQRCGPSFTALSHIDVFTYNAVFLDLLCISGNWFYCFGVISNQGGLLKAGTGMFSLFTCGQMLFHLITCVERYLAVVHPIFYLRLRGAGGVRVRDATIGCVWLVSCAVLLLVFWGHVSLTLITGLLLFFTSVAFCFCSLSVLCALIRPGPGEGGGNRERVDQSKQRAFRTMTIITGVLSLSLLGNLIIVTIQNFSEPYGYVFCVWSWSSLWFFMPSSLVLPLLFLQREGSLPGCGAKSEESA